MPTCPYCHVKINEDVDMTDFETYDSKVYLYYIGNCDKCHRAFKWRATYTLVDDFDKFEEITP